MATERQSEHRDRDGRADFVWRTSLRTGELVADGMETALREQALAAKRTRQAQGLDLPPAPPPAGTVSTAGWPCTVRTHFAPAALCRVLLADVRLADLPADVREQLRAHGCGEWLDDPAEVVTLEAAVVGTVECGGVVGPRYGPPPRVALAELAARVRSGQRPAERREEERQWRESAERRAAEVLARQREEDERRLAEARERAARESEAERRYLAHDRWLM